MNIQKPYNTSGSNPNLSFQTILQSIYTENFSKPVSDCKEMIKPAESK